MSKLKEIFVIKEAPGHDFEFDIFGQDIGMAIQELCDMLQPGEIITIDPKGPGGHNPMVRIKVKSPTSAKNIEKYMSDHNLEGQAKMKVKANDLFEVVRQVVRDELKKALPEMIQRTLTEGYLKKMVAETVRTNKKTVTELLTTVDNTDEEAIPEPQQNSDKGIYNNSDDMLKKESVASRIMSKKNPLLSSENPLSFVYENVKIPGEEEVAPSVPLDNIMPDFSKMNSILEATGTTSRKPMQQSPEAKMRELEQRRKALDVPVQGNIYK